jgi:hypothetical protein
MNENIIKEAAVGALSMDDKTEKVKIPIYHNKWIWVLCYIAAVALYAIADLTDIAGQLRELAIWPIYALMWLIHIHAIIAIDRLDVDFPGIAATVLRVLSFSVFMAVVIAPIYLYLKSKKKAYLFLVAIIAVWIVLSYILYFLILISMTGMME